MQLEVKDLSHHIKSEENELRKLKQSTKNEIRAEIEMIQEKAGKTEFEFKRINSYIESNTALMKLLVEDCMMN